MIRSNEWSALLKQITNRFFWTCQRLESRYRAKWDTRWKKWKELDKSLMDLVYWWRSCQTDADSTTRDCGKPLSAELMHGLIVLDHWYNDGNLAKPWDKYRVTGNALHELEACEPLSKWLTWILLTSDTYTPFEAHQWPVALGWHQTIHTWLL